jgi:hypothetical protein
MSAFLNAQEHLELNKTRSKGLKFKMTGFVAFWAENQA